jgi:hypothetical protein
MYHRRKLASFARLHSVTFRRFRLETPRRGCISRDVSSCFWVP